MHGKPLRLTIEMPFRNGAFRARNGQTRCTAFRLATYLPLSGSASQQPIGFARIATLEQVPERWLQFWSRPVRSCMRAGARASPPAVSRAARVTPLLTGGRRQSNWTL